MRRYGILAFCLSVLAASAAAEPQATPATTANAAAGSFAADISKINTALTNLTLIFAASSSATTSKITAVTSALSNVTAAVSASPISSSAISATVSQFISAELTLTTSLTNLLQDSTFLGSTSAALVSQISDLNNQVNLASQDLLLQVSNLSPGPIVPPNVIKQSPPPVATSTSFNSSAYAAAFANDTAVINSSLAALVQIFGDNSSVATTGSALISTLNALTMALTANNSSNLTKNSLDLVITQFSNATTAMSNAITATLSNATFITNLGPTRLITITTAFTQLCTASADLVSTQINSYLMALTAATNGSPATPLTSLSAVVAAITADSSTIISALGSLTSFFGANSTIGQTAATETAILTKILNGTTDGTSLSDLIGQYNFAATTLGNLLTDRLSSAAFLGSVSADTLASLQNIIAQLTAAANDISKQFSVLLAMGYGAPASPTIIIPGFTGNVKTPASVAAISQLTNDTIIIFNALSAINNIFPTNATITNDTARVASALNGAESLLNSTLVLGTNLSSTAVAALNATFTQVTTATMTLMTDVSNLLSNVPPTIQLQLQTAFNQTIAALNDIPLQASILLFGPQSAVANTTGSGNTTIISMIANDTAIITTALSALSSLFPTNDQVRNDAGALGSSLTNFTTILNTTDVTSINATVLNATLTAFNNSINALMTDLTVLLSNPAVLSTIPPSKLGSLTTLYAQFTAAVGDIMWRLSTLTYQLPPSPMPPAGNNNGTNSTAKNPYVPPTCLIKNAEVASQFLPVAVAYGGGGSA